MKKSTRNKSFCWNSPKSTCFTPVTSSRICFSTSVKSHFVLLAKQQLVWHRLEFWYLWWFQIPVNQFIRYVFHSICEALQPSCCFNSNTMSISCSLMIATLSAFYIEQHHTSSTHCGEFLWSDDVWLQSIKRKHSAIYKKEKKGKNILTSYQNTEARNLRINLHFGALPHAKLNGFWFCYPDLY